MSLIGRLISFLRPYAWQAILGLTLAVTLTWLSLVPPMLMRILIDDAIMKHNRVLLLWLTIALLGVYLASTLLSMVRNYLMAWLGQRVLYDLRTRLYEHVANLDMSFFEARRSGQIMSRITGDVTALEQFIVHNVPSILIDLITLVGIAIVLFRTNVHLALIALLPAPLLAILTVYYRELAIVVYRRLWNVIAEMHSFLIETLSGIKVIQCFNQEEREVKRFRGRCERIVRSNLDAARLSTLFFPTMGFISTFGLMLVWWIGGNQVLDGQITIGVLTMFTMYLRQFYVPVQNLTYLNDVWQRTAAAAERVFEILDTKPEIEQPSQPIKLGELKGEVVFDRVSFSYNGNGKQDDGALALRDISLKVRPGETIGIVGRSGAGKTTLTALVARFYDPKEGRILIDGHDLRQLDLKALREKMGVVLQEPFLFHGTIYENIAYGRPNATMEEIIKAAKAANAHQFILNFPDAYDTYVGERGTKLSGGERQRISIARAILRDPKILILDEATSSVDSESEYAIQKALERLLKGRTTFAIAHRLSTLRNADRLIVLDSGRVVEMGTHEELMQRDGIYKRLVQIQAMLSNSLLNDNGNGKGDGDLDSSNESNAHNREGNDGSNGNASRA
ncbi:MAG: hypothetical protein GDYSWBUE_001664 [Candidatus Fervidibacterota bacterium]